MLFLPPAARSAVLLHRLSYALSKAQRSASLLLAGTLLTACASTTLDRSLVRVDDVSRPYTNTTARLNRADDERFRAKSEVDELLKQSVDAQTAIRLAFAHSPSLQALLAEHAVAVAGAVQASRPGNPVFTFDRLVRGDVLEIGRLLTVGVTDLATLPARGRIADQRIEAQTLRSASDVVQLAFDVRQAWVNAVSAQQALAYAADVKAAAEVSSELARRMLEKGNFSKLQRAREQAFHADAVAQYARADQSAVSARAALVRLLGLDRERAAKLVLPERLPDLPTAPRDELATGETLFARRLDVQIARHDLDTTARLSGLTKVTRWVDGTRLGIARNSESGAPTQRGWELELPLPIFDTGDASSAGAEAAYLAALYRTAQVAVDAQSQAEEAYRNYATSYRLARHYRDEIVPLRAAIADENMLRYNGMLISVFELLADARERIGSVMAAIESQRDFWLADVALDSAIAGRPFAAPSAPPRAAAPVPAVRH